MYSQAPPKKAAFPAQMQSASANSPFASLPQIPDSLSNLLNQTPTVLGQLQLKQTLNNPMRGRIQNNIGTVLAQRAAPAQMKCDTCELDESESKSKKEIDLTQEEPVLQGKFRNLTPSKPQPSSSPVQRAVVQGNFAEAKMFLETVDLPPIVKKAILEICKTKNAGALFALELVETWKEAYHQLEEAVANTAEKRKGIKEKAEERGQFPFVGSSDITPELNKDDLSNIDTIARSLASNFPPASSVYVALGNSPIPIITKLQQTHPTAEVVKMPLGGLSSPPFDSPKAFDKFVTSDELRTGRLMKYLDHFLAPYKADERKIVLVDYASSGTSMVIAQKLLSEYFQDSKRVKTFVYASEANVTDESHLDNYLALAKTGAIETAGNDPFFNKFLQKNEEKLFKNVMHLTLYESVDAQEVMKTDDFGALIKPTLAGYLRLLRMIDPETLTEDDLQ